ncbi:MAG TPA: D-alanyl-D-alanine carboxypeptidase family protein [Candidatus Nitrosocosmicus sp.]|nr:D-alanyl-D-alanine carboxypeptidase family protein [Candidatus Nitrosocosmicus sp.]
MRLKQGKYPEEPNVSKYLVFLNKGQEGIALVLARRLAALARDKGKVLYITSGYRNVERQKQLYQENCRKYPPEGNGYVAKPGNSWHNGRCAVDIDDRGFWKRYMENGDMKRTVKLQELAKYGLCLPLNRMDARTVFEWWHIQPIETLGYTGDRTRYLDPDDEIYDIHAKNTFQAHKEDGIVTVKEFQQITGLVPDGIIGPKTIAKAKEVKGVVEDILKVKLEEVKTGEQAVNWLSDKGVITGPDYWLEQIKHVKYLDILLVKIVNELKG